VTAEGVEANVQLERFRALGCDAGQGSLFGLPGTAEQIDTRLRAAMSPCDARKKRRSPS
jgi:EAL domain-containing protein (putative c-di-GMP-specific phosphodiesterase class I)